MRFARQRAWVRLVKARLREALGMVRLLWAAQRGRLDEVWVGDSHSVTFVSARLPLPGILSGGEGRWIWHLGPRVMYSVARDGLPPWLTRAARLISRTPRGRDVRWMFSFGEIDIRCHLGPRMSAGGDLGFVSDYVARVRSLVDDTGIAHAVVIVPVPPSADTLNHAIFPVKGSVDERLAAHGAVRAALRASLVPAPSDSVLQLLDPTETLAAGSGLMQESMTDDRCHTNAAGRAAVRRELDALFALRGTPA